MPVLHASTIDNNYLPMAKISTVIETIYRSKWLLFTVNDKHLSLRKLFTVNNNNYLPLRKTLTVNKTICC